MSMHPDIEQVLISEDEIAAIAKRMGAQITEDYRDKNPLIVATLRGAVVFFADLARAIECPLAMDFMRVYSYGAGTKSSGTVTIDTDLRTDIEGRHVIIVEDILDSGLTLSKLLDVLRERKPASLEIATFLVKDIEGYEPPVHPRYVGGHIPDAFVVGYGLDYAERYRNLPYLGVLKPEVYS